MINLIWTAELFTNSVPEFGDTDDLTLASLLTHLLALLVVSVAVALLRLFRWLAVASHPLAVI